jgi:transcriptional regulator with XRE-family HTH domain
VGKQKATHVDNPQAVGERLRAARRQSELTLHQLAFPGCSPAYISHLERGRRTPSLQVLIELASRLGVAPSHLAWGVDEAAPRGKDHAATSLAIVSYQKAVRQAPTTRARIWALAGLAQAAAAEGEDAQVAAALKEALAELELERPRPADHELALPA